MESRKALVIGNSQYLQSVPLRNPANDARAIALVLKRLGFSTVTGIDLDRDEMEDVLDQFGREIKDADVALFYYAGHGIQVSGQNYILPVDAIIQQQNHLKRRTFALDEVLDVMTSSAASSIAFLDACRDNPFSSTLQRMIASGTRGITRVSSGLAEVSASQGAFVAFATAPNKVAKDGDADHSPFTEAVLKYIEEPDISIGDVLIKVRKEVYEKTDGEQEPWDQSSLRTRFVFRSTTRVIAPESDAPAPTNKELLPIEQPDRSIEQGDRTGRQSSRLLIGALSLCGLAILLLAGSRILQHSQPAPSDLPGANSTPPALNPTPSSPNLTPRDSNSTPPESNSKAGSNPPISSAPVVERSLLETIAAGKWCTASHSYHLEVDKNIIIWTDNLGSVNKESIVRNSLKEAETVTQKSASQTAGTTWIYSLTGPGSVMVKSDKGSSFPLKRC
jgi:uncharacterized caspase-like protein